MSSEVGMERLAITAQQPDIAQHVAIARKHNVGIEIQVYGYDPNLLDGDWQALAKEHQALLRGFEGEVALHGAFYDMNSASTDKQITNLTRERYLLNLRIAAVLGARTVVFHANYFPIIRHPDYLPTWVERQVSFWGDLVEKARELDLVIALENMWEPDPHIIARVLDEVNSPYLAACLDVGHAHLYSDSLPFSAWLNRLERHLVHCHINNNQGLYDGHLPLDAEGGIVDYESVLPMLRALPKPPLVCLEMDNVEDIVRSLRYLGR
jgi:sugar phosphate isomerase/epimerase